MTSALEALAEFERALHSLAALLSDQDFLILHHAVSTLSDIGVEYSTSYPSQALCDPDAEIRAIARSILGGLGVRRAF